MSVPTAVITPTIPSGLSIVQKCTKSQLTSDINAMKKPMVSEKLPMQVNIRPTTVLSKTIGIHDANKNLESSTTGNEVSMKYQSGQKMTSIMNNRLQSIAKYSKLHTALVSTMAESASIAAPKLVKIAPSNTSLSTTNAISDMKASPVIIVQTPAQKLGQKFTSLKILQKCPTPGAIVKQKILNFNEMRKLNSGGSLKPLLLNASAPNSTILSSDTNLGYIQSPPSLIVLKPPTTSTSVTLTQTSTTLQLKPQQLYQTMPSTLPTKPATISFVTTPTQKPTSISIGTKLIPSKILTAVKSNKTDSLAQHPLPVGLTKIPKDTVVNKIAPKDAHGIDFMRMLKAKQSEKSIEPTVSIGQKQMSNKPALEFQSLTNFLSSNDKPKSMIGGATKHTEHPASTNLQIANGKIIEKSDETATDKEIESITISNGKLSNPNGSIKILKAVTDGDVEMTDIATKSDAGTDNGNCVEKDLEKSNTSPRLTGRSKSLTMEKHQSKVRRRYPSYPTSIEKSDENVGAEEIRKRRESDENRTAKPDPIQEIEEPTEENAVKESLEKEQTKIAGDSLECDENIDDSDKSKSVSPDVALAGNVRQIATAAAANPLPISLTSSCVDNKNDDPLTYIKWRHGIGFLRFSNLQFRKNEFNLLEVLEIKESSKSQNNVKTVLKANCNEQPEQIIDLVERKADTGDKSSAIGRKKLESRQRFKRAGMNLLQNVFVWELYLRLMDAQAAPDNLFINPFPSSPNLFEVGMKMEAIDPEHCSLFCVCTVVEKLGYRIRLTFDGYGDKYSFWRNADSMEIFPPGWCAKTGRPLQPPLKYGSEPFDWHRYILKTNGKFAPRSNFTHLNSMVSFELRECFIKTTA